MGTATAHLVSLSGCRLRFFKLVFFLCPWRKFETDEKLEMKERWKHSRSICPYSFMYDLVFVWEMLCGKQEQVVIPFKGIRCLFIWVYRCHLHRHKLICVGVGVCQLVGIRVRVMLENVLVRWWCKRLLCFYESSMLLFAELISADRQKYTQAYHIYLKSCSRKDCYIKIHLSF